MKKMLLLLLMLVAAPGFTQTTPTGANLKETTRWMEQAFCKASNCTDTRYSLRTTLKIDGCQVAVEDFSFDQALANKTTFSFSSIDPNSVEQEQGNILFSTTNDESTIQTLMAAIEYTEDLSFGSFSVQDDDAREFVKAFKRAVVLCGGKPSIQSEQNDLKRTTHKMEQLLRLTEYRDYSRPILKLRDISLPYYETTVIEFKGCHVSLTTQSGERSVGNIFNLKDIDPHTIHIIPAFSYPDRDGPDQARIIFSTMDEEKIQRRTFKWPRGEFTKEELSRIEPIYTDETQGTINFGRFGGATGFNAAKRFTKDFQHAVELCGGKPNTF